MNFSNKRLRIIKKIRAWPSTGQLEIEDLFFKIQEEEESGKKVYKLHTETNFNLSAIKKTMVKSDYKI